MRIPLRGRDEIAPSAEAVDGSDSPTQFGSGASMVPRGRTSIGSRGIPTTRPSFLGGREWKQVHFQTLWEATMSTSSVVKLDVNGASDEQLFLVVDFTTRLASVIEVNTKNGQMKVTDVQPYDKRGS